MVAFRLSPDLLGHTRFAFSPLAEVASAVFVLGNPRAGRIHQPWIEAARRATRGMDLELLTQLVADRAWLPSFLYQPATGPQSTLEAQLRSLERAGMASITADLPVIWGGEGVPARLAEVIARGDDGVREVTGALWDFWERAVAPYWSRVHAVLEDDVAHRAGRIVTGGLYDLLSELHPETSVGDQLLHIDKPHCDRVLARAHLVLVPSVFTYPRLVVDHDDDGRLVLVYGARGAARTWEGIRREDRRVDHLAGLLGSNRAAILTRLTVPMTTSQLADEFDHSLGTVSEHLGRLRASGLLTSWRTGRRVYYRQTPLAATLIQAGLSRAM